jgi:uncharacterized membrane protein YtjA (UPF0391 family)
LKGKLAWAGRKTFGRTIIMLRLGLLFLVIALIAAVFGAGWIEGAAFEAAWIVFVVFIVLAVLSLLGGAFRRPVP